MAVVRRPGAQRRLYPVAALGMLVLLIMLPNLAWVSTSGSVTAAVAGVIVPAILLASLFAALGRRIWICCLLLLPFALLAPLEAFYIARYHHPSSADVIASVFATNTSEATEFFGSQLWPLAVAALAALTLVLAAAYLSLVNNVRWRHRSRALLLVCAAITPAALVISSFATAHGDTQARLRASSVALHGLSDTVALGFPFGAITRVSNYVYERGAIQAQYAKLAGFRFGATRGHSAGGSRQIYVLAIGESSRRNHWQLFGYDRATNPELAEVRNVVPIRNMVTSWFASILAIPLIVTRKPITAQRMTWDEPSVVRAMGEAGFDTAWISNQMPMGEFDSPVSMYALEAKHVAFVNHAASLTDPSYDEDLIKPLRDTIAQTHGDLFIVLHLMGSHLLYDRRYPEAFKQFQPTYLNKDTDVSDGERINNSYDNSILYTDHVLAEVIGVLRDSNSTAALLFASDHGETLPTPTCSTSGHGVGSRYDFEVPALFWHSDLYAAAYPERVAAVRANADQPTLTANVFESLVDMADVSFTGHDQSWSLFSRDWSYRPRFVNSLVGTTNFDGAVFDQQCELILGVGKTGNSNAAQPAQ